MNRRVTEKTKAIVAFAAVFLILIILPGCSSLRKDQKIPVKVLILPKFEVDDNGRRECPH